MNDARSIGKNFLTELDRFIARDINILTCSDIYNIYSNFYQDLKLFKGNSNGFTGLSEYLIFRVFYHHLGGNFTSVQITRDLYDFRSDDRKYRIGQNIPIKVGSRKYYPDVVIFKDDNPLIIVEIKLYLTLGIKSLTNDINKLIDINTEYPGTKGLFISYNRISDKSESYKKLVKEKDSKKWFNYLMLDGNNNLIKESLEQLL